MGQDCAVGVRFSLTSYIADLLGSKKALSRNWRGLYKFIAFCKSLVRCEGKIIDLQMFKPIETQSLKQLRYPSKRPLRREMQFHNERIEKYNSVIY